MLILNQLELHHQDLQVTRISGDEHDVQNLVEMLENSWINVFVGEKQDLVSFQLEQ